MATSSYPQSALSIVIPCHNEEGNCQALVEGIVAALEPSPEGYEVVVVDDASTDDTIAVLARLQQRIPALRVLCHADNCGQSAALLTGIRAARYPVIVTLDGDGQNDPGDIPRLVECLTQAAGEGVQMIAGWRQSRRDTRWRRISSKIANGIRSRLLKDSTPDTGCGLKVFYREAFLSLPSFDHMHRFLPALIQRQGGRVVSVPVHHRSRQTGKSHYGTLDRLAAGIIDILGVLWLMKRSSRTTTTELPVRHDP